jgi:uncharacterized phage protein (TIGR01671 family)
MREIKFRAWDKGRRKYHYGLSNIMLDLGGHLYWQFGYSEPSMINQKEDQNYVLEQFTGLKDRNGKEIYEGDVLTNGNPVKEYEDLFEIVFVDGAFVGKCIRGVTGLSFWHDTLTVIGNIYENPELLKDHA